MAYDNLKIDDVIVVLNNGLKVEAIEEFTELTIANNKLILDSKLYQLQYIQDLVRGKEYKVVSNLMNQPTVDVLNASGIISHYHTEKSILDSDGLNCVVLELENMIVNVDEITILISVIAGLDTVASNRSGLITIDIYDNGVGGTLLTPITVTNRRQARTPIDYVTVTPYDQTDLPTLSGFLASDNFVMSESVPADIFKFINTIDNSNNQKIWIEVCIEPLGGTGKAVAEVKLDILATDYNNIISVQEKDLKLTT